MKLIRSFSIAMLLLFSIQTKAQETINLSLDSAINYAIEHNLLLKNANLKIEESVQTFQEIRGQGLPQVNASVDYSNFFGAEMELSFMPDNPPTIIPFEPTSSLNLTVSQLVFSGNYYVGLQIAKLYKETVKTMHKKTEQNIIEQVTKSYYMILVAEESISIIQKSIINIKDIYHKTESLVKVGMIEQIDADQLSIQVTMLENSLKSSERQLELANNMLRFNLGVDVNTSITLIQNMDEIVESINFETTLANPFFIDNNVDYQLLLSQEYISKEQIALEKMNYLPTISAYFSYTEKLLVPNFDMTPRNVLGVKASIPIFSSGIRKAKHAKAKIQFETVINNKELLNEKLLLQEKQLRFNLRTALDQYKSHLKNVEVSKSVFDSYTLKYNQGLISSLDLITTNSNYLKAESDYIKALIQLLDAEVALRKLNSEL